MMLAIDGGGTTLIWLRGCPQMIMPSKSRTSCGITASNGCGESATRSARAACQSIGVPADRIGACDLSASTWSSARRMEKAKYASWTWSDTGCGNAVRSDSSTLRYRGMLFPLSQIEELAGVQQRPADRFQPVLRGYLAGNARFFRTGRTAQREPPGLLHLPRDVAPHEIPHAAGHAIGLPQHERVVH